jgi:hypothetical protein
MLGSKGLILVLLLDPAGLFAEQSTGCAISNTPAAMSREKTRYNLERNCEHYHFTE